MVTSLGLAGKQIIHARMEDGGAEARAGPDYFSCPSLASKSSKGLGWSSLCSSFQLVFPVDGPMAGWSLSRSIWSLTLGDKNPIAEFWLSRDK